MPDLAAYAESCTATIQGSALSARNSERCARQLQRVEDREEDEEKKLAPCNSSRGLTFNALFSKVPINTKNVGPVLPNCAPDTGKGEMGECRRVAEWEK